MDAEDGLSGILVPVEDAGAEVTLPIRALLRNRSQNCGLLADREMNANEIFLSHATTLSENDNVPHARLRLS